MMRQGHPPNARAPARSARELATTALSLALVLPLGACGGDDDAATAALLGAWFACEDASCETLARDGFELGEGGVFTSLRLESGDIEDARYCEVPFGSFEFTSGTLTLTPGPDQSQLEPRNVSFDVVEDRATLTDDDGEEIPYARVTGSSAGACTGVLDL